MTFAKRCLYVRTELLFTQAALANKIGVSQVKVAHWENGENTPHVVQYGKFIEFCKESSIEFIDMESGNGK